MDRTNQAEPTLILFLTILFLYLFYTTIPTREAGFVYTWWISDTYFNLIRQFRPVREWGPVGLVLVQVGFSMAMHWPSGWRADIEVGYSLGFVNGD